MKSKFGMKFILVGIILLQCVLIFYFGQLKNGFFIDEIYSYILANSYDADKISTAPQLWNQWIETTEYDEMITVQEGEGFAFATVYKNNVTDCHPPLYYWILNSVCSLFPNEFSKWFGIGINIVFYIIAAVMLYKVGEELFQSKKMALVPLLFYGFSTMSINTAVYIRMYMMLTFFAVWFMYIQINIVRKGISNRRLFALFICTFLGVFTHYYFGIFAFWGILFWVVRLFLKKEYKKAVIYGSTALGAILLLVLVYPAVLSHVLGSETNNVGNEIMSNLTNVSLWVKMTKSMVGVTLSSFGAYEFLILILFGAFLIWLFVYIGKRDIVSKETISALSWHLGWNISVMVCTFLSITFIGGEYVYMRYFLFLMPQLFLILSVMLKFLFESLRLSDNQLIIFVTLLSIWSSYFVYSNEDCAYLYNDRGELATFIEENAGQCYGVMVTREDESNPVAQIYPILRNLQGVYMGSREDVLENRVLDDIFETEPSGLIIINTDQQWSEGYDADEVLSELSEIHDYTTCFYIGEVGDVEIYYVIK